MPKVFFKCNKRRGLEQRDNVTSLLKEGFTQTDIADHLGIHRSTIGRALKNKIAVSGKTTNIYDPEMAHKKYEDSKKLKVGEVI